METKELLNKLYRLENDYFKLIKMKNVKETQRCLLEAKVNKHHINSKDEQILITITELEKLISITEEEKNKEIEAKNRLIEETSAKNKELEKIGFVQLNGSIKQQEWANTIRFQIISDLENLLNQSTDEKGLRHLNFYFKEKRNFEIYMIEDAIERIKKETSSTFFIDNRYEKSYIIALKYL